MKHLALAGTTSYLCHVLATSTATGRGQGGLTSGQCSMSYMRLGASAAVAVPVIPLVTLGTFAGNAANAAFGEIRTAGVPNNTGLYELHLPNNGLAVGARVTTFFLTDAGNSEAWVVSPLEFQLGADDTSTSLFDVSFTEPSGVFTWPATLRSILSWLGALGRNRRTATATTEALRNDANSSDLATSTHSDDGVTSVRGEWT